MYSLDVRKFVIIVYNKLNSLRKTSELLGISKSTISRWKHHTEKKMYKKRGSKLNNPIVIDAIRGCLRLHQFASVGEIQRYLWTTCEINVSNELLRLFMKEKMKLTYQKPRFYPIPNESRLEQKTLDYIEEFENSFFKSSKRTLVSIDEVGFSSNTRPLKGWNKKGSRYRPTSIEKNIHHVVVQYMKAK
jgi:transposase